MYFYGVLADLWSVALMVLSTYGTISIHYVSGGEDLEGSAIKLAAAFDSQQSVAWNARKAWKAALVHFRTNEQLYAALKDTCPFTIGIHDIPSLESLRDKLEEMKQQYDVKVKIAKATKASNKEEVKRLIQQLHLTWAQMFRELEVYVAMRGHLWDGNVPAAYKMTSKFSDTLGKEIKLGSWVRTQKLTLKSGKLDEKLKGRLERIGLKLSIRLRG